MSPFHRRLALYGLLASCAAGAIGIADIDSSQAADIVAAVPTGSARARQVNNAAAPIRIASALPLEKMARTFIAGNEVNPFGIKSWQPAVVPPPPQIVAQPEPVAPQLPFVFAGKMEVDPGKWLVYLAKGDQSFGVSKGDVFDGVYRYDGMESGNLVITYLPLATKQLLPVGIEISE